MQKINNSSKSWADIATSSSKIDVADWPDINGQNKTKIEGNNRPECVSYQVNALTNMMQELVTNDEEQEKTEISCKSRDDIRAERKLRRKAKTIEKDQLRFQKKLAQIREPKTEKLKVVDKYAMENYLTNQQIAGSENSRIKSKKHLVKMNLLDLIDVQVVTPIDRSYIAHKQTVKIADITQRHKGKKREFQKKKYLSKLKKSILLSRILRQNKSYDENVTVEESSIDMIDSPCSENTQTKSIKEQSCIEVGNEKIPEMVPPPTTNVKFSRKFRPYCDNYTTPELCQLTEALLRDIFRFQDRSYNKNEIKARAQKRYVVGIKETMRQLEIGKVKLLIIAPDLEQSTEAGGITDTIDELKRKCQSANVPYVFSLKRRQLGYVLLKKVPASCVGVLNYQGSEQNSQKLLPLIQEEKIRFRSIFS